MLVNGLIAIFVLIGGILGGGYLYLRRSLPPLSGTLKIAGLLAPVTVYRDKSATPHIVAQNRHDLYFAQGYITATDRLFQIDATRRIASGKLSEVLGERFVETDKFYRNLTLRRAAEASVAAYPKDILEIMQAYADGVNAWINQAKKEKRLPPEFLLLRYEPEPWSLADSIIIVKFLAYNLSGNWFDEIWRYQLIERVGLDKAAELFPEYPADATTTMAYISQNHLPLEKLLATAQPPDPELGSNNWVLAGKKTATGLPLLANDPHLFTSAPAAWYQTHLVLKSKEGEGLNVLGVAFAGMPGIVVGRNQHIAWGLTNLRADVQDLYIEKPNPENPYEFLYDERYEPAQVLVETIKVKGREKPIFHEVLVTRHGPIITPMSQDVEKPLDVKLALKWVSLEPTTEIAAIVNWNYARNWEEFREALRSFQGPGQNFVFASVDGTIAYRANAKIPIRRQGNGTIPVPGWTQEYEWQGFIPFEELPEVVNPVSGFIATANNKVIDDAYPYLIASSWAPPYREQCIVSQLQSAQNWRVKDMQALQNDFTDLQAAKLLPILLPALKSTSFGKAAASKNSLEQQAIKILSDWDFVNRADSNASAIWHGWYQELQKELLIPTAGMKLLPKMVLTFDIITDHLIVNASQGQVASILPEDGLAGLAKRSFHKALKNLKKRLGLNIADWQWGKLHTVTFNHPLGIVPLLDRLLNVGPIPIGGGFATVNNQSFERNKPNFPVILAGSWRFVTDLSTKEKSWTVLSPGQSGHPFSPHYRDWAKAWVKGEYQEHSLEISKLSHPLQLNLLPIQDAKSASLLNMTYAKKPSFYKKS